MLEACNIVNQGVRSILQTSADAQAQRSRQEWNEYEEAKKVDEANWKRGLDTDYAGKVFDRIVAKDKQEHENKKSFWGGVAAIAIIGAGLSAVVALPVIGFNMAKDAWTEYQQKSSPDLSVVAGGGGKYYTAKGLTGAEAERAALAACKSAGSSYCNVGATVSSQNDFCVSTMQNKRSGIHVFETVTDPKNDPLRKLREESITGYEQSGTKGTEWTDVRYFCNTDSMAQKFAPSSTAQQELTTRENTKAQALHEARTDIKAIPSGAYLPRTVPIVMLDGPSDRLRVKEEINDNQRCIWVFNGEAGFEKARVRVLGYGDKVVGGLINKQDLKPDTEGLCAEDVLRMQQRSSSLPVRPELPAAPAATTTGPQQGAATPSAPTRIVVAPSTLSFQQQLAHYGISENGKEPTYEGRIAQNSGPLKANLDGSPNDKGLQNLRDIRRGSCVLTINFGKSAILNSHPVYVPVPAADGKTAIVGGWYQGSLGAKCDI